MKETTARKMAEAGAAIAAQDWPRAERLLRRIAQGKAPPASALYNLAKVLQAAGKPDQAPAWLRRAVAADPAHQAAWFELGRALIETDKAAAGAAFARAAALDPSDVDAQRNHGRLAARLGAWAEARAAWERTAALAPGDAEAALERLRALYELRDPEAEAEDARLSAIPALRPRLWSLRTHVSAGRLSLR